MVSNILVTGSCRTMQSNDRFSTGETVPTAGFANANEQLNIPAVFLRCSFFMQNINTTHREDIRLRDMLFMSAGNSKTSFIDVRDIAAVAVKILTESPDRSKQELLSNRAYDLTGATALTYYEVATILTTVLARYLYSLYNYQK